MSTDAYARQTQRESYIWKPFVYSFPFNDNQTQDRSIIFGLYANSYLNSQGYLAELESEDLANLLADYNSKISGLTNEQLIVVADISSKRYIASVDQLIHDNKMTTQRAKIDAESDEWDAKIAALSADEAALSTMAVKVATEIEKTNARIAELEAYIEMEGINLSQVDIEIAEKEIQSAKLDVQKLNTANEILRIQLETVNKASDLVDIDVRIARTKADVAETERNIAKIDLLENDVTIEQAQTTIAEAEEDVEETKNTLIIAKGADLTADKAFQASLLAREATNFNNKGDLIELNFEIKENNLIMDEERNRASNDNRVALAELERDLAEVNKTAQATIDSYEASEMFGRVADVTAEVDAAISAKEALLEKPLIQVLTHMIGRATSE
jgi:hypothetical protein